jgi:hypothetical protein
MRNALLSSLFLLLCLGLAANAGAQTIVPAGTLLQCTLNEPNFSSATANVGDPVVCYLRTVQQFGRIVLPRGSYLQGHLAAAKEPGHLWGKGSLRLEFDRIGLPNSDIPVPSKVIGASGGYKTDREGDIRGKGHATRDVVEWMLPPLWPWKMINLPARGPRPTFKGEELLTLRLMDDVVVPKITEARPALAPGWRYFNDPSLKSGSYNVPETPNQSAGMMPASARFSPQAAARITVIALKSEEVFEVTRYRIDGGRFTYVLTDGTLGSTDAADVDWTRTSRLNLPKATSSGTFVTQLN